MAADGGYATCCTVLLRNPRVPMADWSDGLDFDRVSTTYGFAKARVAVLSQLRTAFSQVPAELRGSCPRTLAGKRRYSATFLSRATRGLLRGH